MLEKRKKSTQGDFPVSEVSKGTALQSSATGEARGGAMQTSKAVQRRKTPFFNFRRIQWRQQHWNTFWITSVPLSAVIHERHPSAYSTLGPCPTNPPGGACGKAPLPSNTLTWEERRAADSRRSSDVFGVSSAAPAWL